MDMGETGITNWFGTGHDIPKNAGAYYENQLIEKNGAKGVLTEGYSTDNYTNWAIDYINGNNRSPDKPGTYGFAMLSTDRLPPPIATCRIFPRSTFQYLKTFSLRVLASLTGCKRSSIGSPTKMELRL